MGVDGSSPRALAGSGYGSLGALANESTWLEQAIPGPVDPLSDGSRNNLTPSSTMQRQSRAHVARGGIPTTPAAENLERPWLTDFVDAGLPRTSRGSTDVEHREMMVGCRACSRVEW